MAEQYYYDKHEIDYYWDEISDDSIDSKKMYSDQTSTTDNSSGQITDSFLPTSYEGYEIVADSSTGGYTSYKFSYTGDSATWDIENDGGPNEDKYYHKESPTKIKELVVDYVITDSSGNIDEVTYHYEDIIELDPYTIYKHREKGSYIETIVANDGSYPDDGIEDGYWWVKGDKPTVSIDESDKTVDEGQTLSFTVNASIDGTSTITYSASDLPEGATLDEETGEFEWSPDYTDSGSYDVTLEAEANGSTDSQTITITVNNVERDPGIEAIDDIEVGEDDLISFTVEIINPDDVDISLTHSDLPDGATFDDESNEFEWQTDYFDSGSYSIDFTVNWSDGSSTETVNITVNDTHRPPEIIQPDKNTETNDRTPTFEFETKPNYEEDSNKYHARIRIANKSDITDIEKEFDTTVDRSNWEYYDGSEWIDFPFDGVSANTKVRVTPSQRLSFGFFYWIAQTYETDYGYGSPSKNRKLRILISTDEPYVLLIGDEQIKYQAYSLTATEASNGELGSINFALNNEGNTANEAINYNDEVLLAINDKLGNQEQFKGIIRQKNPNGKVLEAKTITGDGLLAERRIKEDYPEQDIGQTAKQIIDDYCSPLTTNNVNTSTGYTKAIKATDKTPLKVLEELRRNYQIYYFVDSNWDVHLYLESEVDGYDTSRFKIKYGDS